MFLVFLLIMIAEFSDDLLTSKIFLKIIAPKLLPESNVVSLIYGEQILYHNFDQGNKFRAEFYLR